ncbi:MAG: sulfite reductase (NADPH) flavoprotein alpha-component [Cryomorphaceae bacterium]|jgi:sulfite reductase (NADPH) flavoprotein alpha-component
MASLLDQNQQALLESLAATLSPSQAIWVSGYTAALGRSATSAVTSAPAAKNITVLYGTESGNCEMLAEKISKAAKKKGHKAKLTNMSEISAKDLAGMDTLFVIISTWGDGEPPETAETFYNELMKGGIDLKGVDFSVCALGDTSYDKYCQTGIDIDNQLEKLGGKRIVDRVDCDVDFDDAFATWEKNIWENLGASATAATAAPLISAEPTIAFDKKNPYPAEILENVLLSGACSAKETFHVEFSLEGSGFQYEPGDVLCVIPQNAADTVSTILSVADITASAEVELKNIGKTTLGDALKNHLDITGVSKKVASNIQALSSSDNLAELIAGKSDISYKDWSYGREIIDLLEFVDLPATLTAQQLVDCFRALPPRLYSIASSPKAHPDEVHLTIAAVRYQTYDKERKGVASSFLADEGKIGTKVNVYLHKNKNFRLPENNDTPIIMVGPGTGIAPFRAFIEERAEDEAKGASWLFFGDQKYNEDFLYQLEFQDHLKSGALTKLDVAFSRDQPEKIYVQHKMQEAAAELWIWLEKGAHFYVCGDASRMAKDVNDTLIDIISTEGKKTKEEATEYLTALKKDKRYQRDVY